MKKYITLLITALILASTVMAATLSRTAPSSVSAGQQFTVTYTASSVPAGKWFVAWEDTITGGCVPVSGGNPIKGFTASEIGESITKSITAPSSGSCTFSGFYQFAGSNQQNLPSATITISGTTGEKDYTIWYVVGGIAVIFVLFILLKKK